MPRNPPPNRLVCNYRPERLRLRFHEFFAPKHIDIWKGWFAASLVLFGVMLATWVSGSDYLSLHPFWLAYVVPSAGMTAMSGAFLLRCHLNAKGARTRLP